MDTQVWMKLAQQFKKTLSFYNSLSGESDIDVLRPHLRNAGKSYFQLLQENEHIEITTPPEFLVKPVLENVTDGSGRTHRFTNAHDLYWICVLGLLGRCGYIIVKNKKLREMQIPTSHIDGEIKVDWELFYMGRTETFLFNDKDYLTDVCEASIQACRFFISEYGDVAKKSAEKCQGNKATNRKQEGKIEPKAPEILQKILWVWKYGRNHWILVSSAILFLLIIWILPKLITFSKGHQNTRLESETSQHSSETANIFADVSKDGSILRSNKFPWKIQKSIDQDGNILYTIVDRRGDATAISVVPDNPKYTVYQSYGGMVIKYTCAEEKISDFTIKVKY